MASLVEQYQARLDLYLSAEQAILQGAQSYGIGSRNLTRADLKEVRSTIEYLTNMVSQLQSKQDGKGRNRVFGIIPRDF